MFLLLKMLVTYHRTYSKFVFEIFKAVAKITVFLIAAPRRAAGLSTVFPEDFLKICLLPSVFGGYKFSSEKAIEITGGKAFRLFSGHRKRFILLNSSLSKEKNRKRLIIIKFPDMNLA